MTSLLFVGIDPSRPARSLVTVLTDLWIRLGSVELYIHKIYRPLFRGAYAEGKFYHTDFLCFLVLVEAVRRADPPSKDPYRLSYYLLTP